MTTLTPPRNAASPDTTAVDATTGAHASRGIVIHAAVKTASIITGARAVVQGRAAAIAAAATASTTADQPALWLGCKEESGGGMSSGRHFVKGGATVPATIQER